MDFIEVAESFSDEDEEVSEIEDYESGDEEIEVSDDDLEEIILEDLPEYLSRDKTIQWYEHPFRHSRRSTNPSLQPGITRYAASRISDIQSSFDLFLPPQLETIILRNTNREGRRVLGATFEDIDTPTLRAYIGLLILAGVYRSNNEATESLWDADVQFFEPSYRTKRSRRSHDSFVLMIGPRGVAAGKQTSLHPSASCGTRGGRCPFRQYMPMKPAKYGMKNWVACDSGTSYVWNIQPYTGRINNTPERNQGMRVVQDLTAGLKGYNITVDNFFTSYELAQKLLKRGITSVGTIRKNKPSIPRVLLESKKWPAQSSKFAFTKDTTLVTYVPKKNRSVILQSTLHTTNSINNKENKKPLIIEDYNASKGAVDTLDKLVACYSTKRKTKRWPVAVFCNIIDISCYNAFILFTQVEPDWNKSKLYRRRLFLEQLGRALVNPYMQMRKSLPRALASADIVLKSRNLTDDTNNTTTTKEESAKRGRCKFCPKDIKTSFTCNNCKRQQEEREARQDEKYKQWSDEIFNEKEVNEEQKESAQEVACRENEKSQYEGTPEVVEQIAETTKQLRDSPEEPEEGEEGPVVGQNVKLVLQKVSNQEGNIQKEVIQQENANEIPKPMDGGLKKRKSTIDCINSVINSIQHLKSKKLVPIAVIVDFTNAFELVDIDILSEILTNIRTPIELHSWIINFLSNRTLTLNTMQTVVNNGLPQGSCLNPTLFNLYTAELHKISDAQNQIFQFADDCLLLTSGPTI
ncbi:unnamed protein product [Hermetia illucens]|uniref:Reverse transcriptase domain-containing protein n=1 Tax=Hermetia illucens TaxID=343691 RepID=A0A7R8YTB2_HERIL|nr:unnamed protein product [Hermetia illucens]